jgi:transmembrane protein 70
MLSSASPSYTIRSIPGALRSAKVASVLPNRAALYANRVASLHTSATSCDTNTSATATTTFTTKSKSGEEGKFELVYRGPLRSAVRAVKVFSLTTCAAALVGGPVLVTMGNPSVPLLGRVLMTAFVMTIGVSTTLILHWLMKGYVIEMYFDPKSENLRVYTLTMFAGKRCHTFHLSEAGPPENIAAFSTFQAKGKSFFMHAEVMENKELLGKILGPYMKLEDSEFWKQNEEVSSNNNSNIQQDKTQ